MTLFLSVKASPYCMRSAHSILLNHLNVRLVRFNIETRITQTEALIFQTCLFLWPCTNTFMVARVWIVCLQPNHNLAHFIRHLSELYCSVCVLSGIWNLYSANQSMKGSWPLDLVFTSSPFSRGSYREVSFSGGCTCILYVDSELSFLQATELLFLCRVGIVSRIISCMTPIHLSNSPQAWHHTCILKHK